MTEVYKDYTLVGINEVFYPSVGWRQCKTNTTTSVASWINYYKGLGVTVFNLILEDGNGCIVMPDFGLEDLQHIL